MGFFGTMLILGADDATYIFIALLMFLLIFKAGLHILEIYCNRNGFKELLENLYREFMMMGLISFGVFVSNEAYDYANSSVYNSFHFAHMLILFIGLTFILQAILIIALVASRKGVLLRFSLISSNQLLDDYHKLMSSNNIQSLLFRNGPLSISFPELREKIENRILKDFFIRSFNLPEEFNFAIYTCRALKSYVISLSEVRPLNWFILAIFASINYAKVRILDGRLKDVHCFVVNPDKNQRGSRYLAAQWSSPISTDRNLGPLIPPYSHPISHGFESETVDMDQMSSGSRSLAGGVYYTEAELCREYFLSYSVFCAFMLTLFLTALLIVSEVYMRRLLDKVLEMEIDLEWQDVEEVEEEESFILQEAEQFEKEIEQTQEKTKTTDASFTSISPMNSVPSIDAAPLTFSLLLPTSTPSSPTRNTTPPAFTPIWSAQSAPHSSDYIPNPSPTSNATFPAHVPIPIPAMTPYSVPLHSRRARSVTSPDPYDEKFLNYRSKIHAIGKGRAQSMNRGRSHTVNFGLPDSQMRRESMAVSPSTSDSAVSHSRSRSVTMAVTGALGIGVDAVSPRLPPQSVIQEHEQQMKEMERIRGRSNTFIQYMSDSLPVTLLNSRFLYQKCLERICRAEENRHLRNRKTLVDQSPVPAPATAPTSAPTTVPVPVSIPSYPSVTKGEKTYTAYMDSGKEGYERNPLLMPAGTSDYPPEAPPVEVRSVSPPRFVGSPADISVSKVHHSRDGMRNSLSPRPSFTRQRSFTAENILNRAAFQSQHRSIKCHSKDHNESSPPVSSQSQEACSSVSNDPSDSMESGLSPHGRPVEISPKLSSSISASSSTAGTSLWPSAEPEYPIEASFLNKNVRGIVKGKSVLGSEAIENNDSDNIDESTNANTVKNSNTNSDTAHLSTLKSLKRSSSNGNSPVGEERRPPRGRMERAYSDIFFQMAAPEHVTDVKTEDEGGGGRHAQNEIGNNKKYVMYDPENQKKKSPRKWSFICEEVCTKILRKMFYFLRCFFYGLYEILVLGPSVGAAHEEDNQDDEVRIALQKDLSSIFLWGNSDLYFRAIEFSLLLQCFYIALWCTNFALIAVEATDSVKWELFLLIPIPLNFLLLKLILNFACVLRSASVLDEEIAVKICEEAIDERVVTQRLRKMVRSSLLSIEPVKANWAPFLTQVFSHYVSDNRPGLSTKQFSLFLHGIQIHLSLSSIEAIFKVIDFDQSGYITWIEFSSIVFPELFGPGQGEKAEHTTSPGGLPLTHMESVHPVPAGTDGTYSASAANIDRLRQMSVDEDDAFELDSDLHSNLHVGPGSPNSHKSENLSSWSRSPRRVGSRDPADTRSRVVSFSEPTRDRDQTDRVVSLSLAVDRLVSFQDEKVGREHVSHSPVSHYDDNNGDYSEDGLEVSDATEETPIIHYDPDDEEGRIIHLEKIDEVDEMDEDEEEEKGN